MPGHGAQPHQVQIDFLNRQAVQGPVLEVNTGWLEVGHVDEFFSIVPDAANFARVFASPTRAKSILESAPAHEPLFYNNPADGLHQGQADGGSFNTLVDSNPPVPFTSVIGWYLRIYDGPGAHQIAQIITTGTTANTARVGVVWHFEDTADVYDAIHDDSIVYRSLGWNLGAGVPGLNSKYILVPATKSWLDDFNVSFPALITAQELRSDVPLWTTVNFPAEELIDQAWYSIHNALNSYAAPSINIPGLFMGALGPTGQLGDAVAYVPGAANLQVWGSQLWIAAQFGPRDPVTRQDLFENEITSLLNSTGERVVSFVDDWNTYHRRSGEVHCGTGVIRLSPNEIFDHWWEFEPEDCLPLDVKRSLRLP